MNLAEEPHQNADSSVSWVHCRSAVFRISKPLLSKFITPSRPATAHDHAYHRVPFSGAMPERSYPNVGQGLRACLLSRNRGGDSAVGAGLVHVGGRHQTSPQTPRPVARLVMTGKTLVAVTERRSKEPSEAASGSGSWPRIPAILAPAIGPAHKGEVWEA